MPSGIQLSGSIALSSYLIEALADHAKLSQTWVLGNVYRFRALFGDQ